MTIKRDTIYLRAVYGLIFTDTSHRSLRVIRCRKVIARDIGAQVNLGDLQVNIFPEYRDEEHMDLVKRITRIGMRPQKFRGKTHLRDNIVELATRDRQRELATREQPPPLFPATMRLNKQRCSIK